MDLIEAGKGLAFDVPTAAAFHTLRAVETVIRQYYQFVLGAALPGEKMRNWGRYIKDLKEHGADQKVTAALEQIKDLHRNPVLHPEATLTSDEATTLFGIVQSAIIAIVLAMKNNQNGLQS